MGGPRTSRPRSPARSSPAAPVVACLDPQRGPGSTSCAPRSPPRSTQVPPREATGVFRLPIRPRVHREGASARSWTGTVLGGAVRARRTSSPCCPAGSPRGSAAIEVHRPPRIERAGRRPPRRDQPRRRRGRRPRARRPARPPRPGRRLARPRRRAPPPADRAPGRSARAPRVLVHHGTTQVLASLVLVDHREAGVGTPTAPPAGAGGSAPRGNQSRARRHRESPSSGSPPPTPLGALPGDRFIVRGFVATATHGTTIGGGRVIRVLAPRRTQGLDPTADHRRPAPPPPATTSGSRLDIKTPRSAGPRPARPRAPHGVPGDRGSPRLLANADRQRRGCSRSAAGDHTTTSTRPAVAELEGPHPQGRRRRPRGRAARGAAHPSCHPALPVRTYDAILAGLERKAAIAGDGDRVRKASAPGPRRPP